MKVAIRRAAAADLPDAKSMLEDAGLPVEDLTAAHLAAAAVKDGRIVGVIGVEDFGEVGLLRSLVVAADARAARLGRDLVAALEDDVCEKGMRELWLLTIDADAWFQRLGYVVRDRSDAPAAIRSTAEFSDLCPGDAVLMSKKLQK